MCIRDRNITFDCRTSRRPEHFIKCVKRTTGFECHQNIIYTPNKLVKADAFPIGIDYDKFHNKHMAAIPSAHGEIEQSQFILWPVNRADASINVVLGGNYYGWCIRDAFESILDWQERDRALVSCVNYHLIGTQIQSFATYTPMSNLFSTLNPETLSTVSSEYRALKRRGIRDYQMPVHLNGERIFGGDGSAHAVIASLYYWTTTDAFVQGVTQETSDMASASYPFEAKIKRDEAMPKNLPMTYPVRNVPAEELRPVGSSALSQKDPAHALRFYLPYIQPLPNGGWHINSLLKAGQIEPIRFGDPSPPYSSQLASRSISRYAVSSAIDSTRAEKNLAYVRTPFNPGQVSHISFNTLHCSAIDSLGKELHKRNRG